MENRKKYIMTFISTTVVSFCLRPAITGIGSVLQLIKQDLGLSDSASGLLTTIPMISFAVFSPFVDRLNDRFGTTKTLLSGFAFIIIGTFIRSFAGLPGLFIGTLIIGAGIAFGNVLIPAIIKSEFPLRFGIVMACNTTCMALSSGLASGVNYPLSESIGAGWRTALLLWAVLAFIAVVLWMPSRRVNIQSKHQRSEKNLFRNGLAWWVTLFIGIVALIFYSCLTWLFTIFHSKGLSSEAAGYYVSAFQLTGIASSFIVPYLSGKRADQRPIAYTLVGLFIAGIALINIFSNNGILLAATLIGGFAGNGLFALSMSLIGFRSSNGSDATKLSSMSQSLGYVIAAFGPIAFGMLNELSGGWVAPLWVVVALGFILLFISSRCAKPGTV